MINGKKSKEIWGVTVFLLFEDCLITENITVGCFRGLPSITLSQQWQGIRPDDRQRDRQGVAYSLDNFFPDYPSSE